MRRREKAREGARSHLLRGEIEVCGGARPAPAVELGTVTLLDEELLLVRLLVDSVEVRGRAWEGVEGRGRAWKSGLAW